SGIARTTTHALSNCLPFCSVPSRGRLSARIATGKPLRLPQESTRTAHLFPRRDRSPCPRCHETPAVRLVASQDICDANQLVSSNWDANLGGVASASLRHHSQRFADSQNQISEKPIGTVARHCSDGLGSLSDAASRKATWWRPSLRFGRWATARV